jgi:hypothetical protein
MIKVLFEIYKVLGRMGIKPKDVIGMGGNIVKMGKSLFNTRPNPKLLTFIEKNQKIPPKILENIKLHARTLKNASENQKNLFLENIKSIQKAKFPKVPKPPVTSVQRPATSVKEQGLEAFKGWKPTVIKGGKDKLADGGRIGFQDGLLAKDEDLDREIKKTANIYTEPETIEEMAGKELEKKGLEQAKLVSETKPTRDKFLPGLAGDKEYQLALTKYYETEKGKKEKEDEMFEMVKEFQKFKRNNPESRMNFNVFRAKKKKEKELFKNAIIKLDLKYPEKKIIDKETNMVNKENLKSAIDEAEASLEISPIEGLILKTSIDTEGDQSVTSGSFDINNFNFTSPNLEEGELTSSAKFDVGNLNLFGTVDTKDSDVLKSGLGFNYDDILKGKFSESGGYKEGELDLNKTFPINDKFDLSLTGEADMTITPDDETYKSYDLIPKLSYDDGTFSADVSKSVLEGSDDVSLNAGASFPLFEKTYSGDLILNEKGEPIFDENGIALRKSDTTKDMGIVTLKGTDLFTDNMGGTIRYQKDWGNKNDNLFFTAGAEKDLFNDDYTYGAGLKYIFAKGGIANHFRKR